MKNTFCILSLLFVVYIVACTDSRVLALPLSLSHVEKATMFYNNVNQ